MSGLFFTSDLHFGHKFMADFRSGLYFQDDVWKTSDSIFPHGDELQQTFATREVKTLYMDALMVGMWNEIVRPNDEVHVIGDFSFHNREDTERILRRLNGNIHLGKGNHDAKWIDQLGWASVYDFKRVKFDGTSFYCFHYPMLTWPNAHKGTYHLHGHSHGNLKAPQSTRMDVGPDATGQMLISAEECKTILDARTYDFIDHHD